MNNFMRQCVYQTQALVSVIMNVGTAAPKSDAKPKTLIIKIVFLRGVPYFVIILYIKIIFFKAIGPCVGVCKREIPHLQGVSKHTE